MTTANEAHNRRRLAELVKLRRQQLDLSVRQAAELGGVARNTWTSLEDGSRRTADNNYGGIERVLKWRSGSIAAILEGGQPTEATTAGAGRANTGQPDAPGNPADEALIRIMKSDMSDQEKAAVMRLLIAEAEAARRKLLDMADDYVKNAASRPSS